MPTIRVAQVSDAKRLAVLAERTFRATFAAYNTADDMETHCRSSYGETIQAGEISSADCVTLVAEHNERLVAYVQLKWGKAPACVAAHSPGEIHRLYVDEDWHGKGLAHDLMAACLATMNERKTDVAWLGVWERNPRAVSFYRKFDFREVGDQVFWLGADPQMDIVMARGLRDVEP
jgi:ribosomal protein S18 acetylase RimI-like enzyme